VSESKNKTSAIKHLRPGLSIYKTGRSPYWLIRLRDPYSKRYVTRSSKELSRVEAIAAANEFSDSYFRKANGNLAAKKTTSFEHYAECLVQMQKGTSKWPESDNKLLNRKGDGIVAHFGKHDVSKITTMMVRQYLAELNANRQKPLAESTKAKHVIIIRKVLALAVEDGLIKTVPVMPKQKTIDSPRATFTDKEYKKFMKVGLECIKRGDKVRGVQITWHHIKMFKFIVHSFLRPTTGELFGLRHKDLEEQTDPSYFNISVHGGKTGKRISATMPICVPLYNSLFSPGERQKVDKNQHVWMPEYPNRTTAINTARRIFNHILIAADLSDETTKLSPYSLRHYALQSRLSSSNGKVNIYTLAKNAGTSVDQLERFYLKSMAPTNEMVRNLQLRD